MGRASAATTNICAPYTTAFAGLLKATFFLADPGSAFQPYLSLSAGGGYIRHVSKVNAPNRVRPDGHGPLRRHRRRRPRAVRARRRLSL